VIAYLDSSVVLRVVLGQDDALERWHTIEVAVVNDLVQVECLRTLDRLRVQALLSDAQIAERRHAVYRLLAASNRVELNRFVLDRASQPLPTSLGTLDAIHLATTLVWRETRDDDIVMATHDRTLALAARATGLDVIGV
jgi:predicted nucleic acid-binding protein